jgi:hypothetical protein
LTGEEAAYFSTLHHVVRQNSYLLGRYTAKLALSELFSEKDLRAVEVGRGVFEQPIVQYVGNPGYSVTIRHAGTVAVALGYPVEHAMASILNASTELAIQPSSRSFRIENWRRKSRYSWDRTLVRSTCTMGGTFFRTDSVKIGVLSVHGIRDKSLE